MNISSRLWLRQSATLLVLSVLVIVFIFALGCRKSDQSVQTLRALNNPQDIERMQYPQTEEYKLDQTIDESVRNMDLARPISLSDAIAYAVANNLEAAVANEEVLFQQEASTGAIFHMLPSLIVSAERSWKDRHVPSRSENYVTRVQSLAPSISTEKETRKESVELSWDILNLAVNFFRWQQEGTRVNISEQRQRRVKQNLIYEVVKAYSRAALAEESAEQARQMIGDLEDRLATIDANISQKLTDKVEGLETEAKIMENVFRLKKLLKEFESAKVELLRLMGVEQGTDIILSGFDFSMLPPELPLDLDSLGEEALKNRPELYESDLEEQVSLDDANQAIAKMFPTLRSYARYDHDDNRYLTRHDWFTFGLTVSWDLLSIPKFYYESRVADRNTSLIRTKRASITAAVLTQLNLAVIEYRDMMEQASQLKALSDKRVELVNTVRQQVELGKAERSLLLEMEEKSLATMMEYHEAYARLLSAEARLNNSLGRDWDYATYSMIAYPALLQTETSAE